MNSKFPEADALHRYRAGKRFIFICSLVLVFFGFFLIFKTTFTVTSGATKKSFLWSKLSKVISYEANVVRPEKEKLRSNYLFLGMRGKDDPDGGLLTDAIMIVSIKENTNEAALVSIPRDLYVEFPFRFSGKINSAFAQGEEHKGKGIEWARSSVEKITGLYIDNVVVLNFNAFKELVDILGGIDIVRDTSFLEEQQWGYRFYLPAGRNHLDGRTALAYIRSRFSSSDFDRLKREQEVLLAIKDKLFSLGVVADPVKMFRIINIISKNARTDISLKKIRNFLTAANKIKWENVKRVAFDDSYEGVLYASTKDGAYVLLPKSGNWSEVQKICQKIFQ